MIMSELFYLLLLSKKFPFYYSFYILLNLKNNISLVCTHIQQDGREYSAICSRVLLLCYI